MPTQYNVTFLTDYIVTFIADYFTMTVCIQNPETDDHETLIDLAANMIRYQYGINLDTIATDAEVTEG
jgi:hypothetical protein